HADRRIPRARQRRGRSQRALRRVGRRQRLPAERGGLQRGPDHRGAAAGQRARRGDLRDPADRTPAGGGRALHPRLRAARHRRHARGAPRPRAAAGGAAAAPATQLSAGYNTTLFSGLATAGTRAIPVDVFSMLSEIRANAAAYGSTTPPGIACGPFPPITTTG